jgi:hypothetical protein
MNRNQSFDDDASPDPPPPVPEPPPKGGYSIPAFEVDDIPMPPVRPPRQSDQAETNQSKEKGALRNVYDAAQDEENV